MKYTKQDVFRHKENGATLLYVGPDPDGNRGIHEFSGADDYHYWSLDEVEYLGRSSKIVLFKDANLEDEYFVGGCGSGLFDDVYKMIKLDTADKRISYKFFDEESREEQWCRHILHVPFYEIINHLDDTKHSPYIDHLIRVVEAVDEVSEVNKTSYVPMMPKLPKALI